MSWVNPQNPLDKLIAEAFSQKEPILLEVNKIEAKEVLETLEKPKKEFYNKTITVYKVKAKNGKKTIVSEEITLELPIDLTLPSKKPIKRKIWLPKTIRKDYRIRRIFG